MKLEFIDRLNGNEVLGKNILSNEGKILLRAGVVLNSLYVKKLKQLGVLYVYIEDKRLDDVVVEDENLLLLKQQAFKSMAKVMKNVGSGVKKDIKETFGVIEDMVRYIIYDGDVNKSLFDIMTYDNYTYFHSIETCITALFLAHGCNLKEKELNDIGICAILHDIGKTKIDEKIINKKGNLDNDELHEIKKHPIYGAEILKKNVNFSDVIIRGVLQHHERVDGNGYPYGLKDKGISNIGKIICVCDVYNAVSNDRVYRKKFRPQDAYELIMAGSGICFDEKLVHVFKNVFSVYPLGSCVRLSNGEEGYVIRQNKGFPDRPVIRVLYDNLTKLPINSYEINLMEHTNVIINELI